MPASLVTIRGKSDREKLHRWVDGVPDLTRVVFHGPKRSLPQNSVYWARLTDISRQKQYHGVWLAPEEWSQLFLDALNREMKIVPNLDGTGLLPLRHSSSQLSHADFSDLLTYIQAWADKEGIVWSDEKGG